MLAASTEAQYRELQSKADEQLLHSHHVVEESYIGHHLVIEHVLVGSDEVS